MATLTIETDPEQSWLLVVTPNDLTAARASLPVRVAVVPVGTAPPGGFSTEYPLATRGIGSSMWDVYVWYSSPRYLDPGYYQSQLQFAVMDE